jgi:hypothetical protein
MYVDCMILQLLITCSLGSGRQGASPAFRKENIWVFTQALVRRQPCLCSYSAMPSRKLRSSAFSFFCSHLFIGF